MKILSISTDRKIFDKNSPVAMRQVEYAKNCEEMHIVVFAGRKFRETALSENCFVYPTRSITKFTYPFDAIRLGRFIIERRGITNITCQDSSFTAMAGLSLKKETGRPLELQVHADIGSPNFGISVGNKIRKAMSLSYLPKADHVRVVSERIKNYLVKDLHIDASKIEVRPIFVDREAVRLAPVVQDLRAKYSRFTKVALMASRITQEKNISLALHAWRSVLERMPGAGLIIVGSGPLRSLLEGQVKNLGLSNSVVFESWADQATLYSYYKTCDVFLNTSLFEGYGMSLVEAIAAGAKVVSTDVGVAREIGARIVSEEPSSVASGILEILGV